MSLVTLYIPVLYGDFGEEENHKHKSCGNQSKALCDCNVFQGCRKPPAYLKQLLCPTPMAAAIGPAGLFEVVEALIKWKGRQKGCNIDSAGEER